jgi:hypothetical protein
LTESIQFWLANEQTLKQTRRQFINLISSQRRELVYSTEDGDVGFLRKKPPYVIRTYVKCEASSKVKTRKTDTVWLEAKIDTVLFCNPLINLIIESEWLIDNKGYGINEMKDLEMPRIVFVIHLHPNALVHKRFNEINVPFISLHLCDSVCARVCMCTEQH